MTNRPTKFDIALSFAGEDRVYVDELATILRSRGIRVFYDLFEEANLWGKNLYDYLSDIYLNQAKFTIMFISEHYSKKMWPNHERQSMQARAFQENEEYILPAKFDETKIAGVLPTIGFLDLNKKTPHQLADIIEKKLIASGITIPSEILRSESSKYNPIPKSDPNIIKVFVKDNENLPIQNAQLVIIAENGTFLESNSNSEGIGTFSIHTKRKYTLLIAHREFVGQIIPSFDVNEDIEIRLQSIPNIGSIIIQSTGYINGIKGRLNPIKDSSSRMYLYADNIAINGGEGQPAKITIDQNMVLEDCDGAVVSIWFRFVSGSTTTLIDFAKATYGNASQ